MARNTTRQGAAFELDVMHFLSGCDCEGSNARPRHVGWRGFGFDCLRSSGSRGAVDVVAVTPWAMTATAFRAVDEVRVLFIQCKITNPVIPPAERARLRDLAGRAGALPIVAHRTEDEITGLKRPHFRILTGEGPGAWVSWTPGEDRS